MDIQESTIWTKYKYLVPAKNRIPEKAFQSFYEEYKLHPQRKSAIIDKVRKMTIKKGYKPTKKRALGKKSRGGKSRKSRK
jgi:hypothetical protein